MPLTGGIFYAYRQYFGKQFEAVGEGNCFYFCFYLYLCLSIGNSEFVGEKLFGE